MDETFTEVAQREHRAVNPEAWGLSGPSVQYPPSAPDFKSLRCLGCQKPGLRLTPFWWIVLAYVAAIVMGLTMNLPTGALFAIWVVLAIWGPR